MEDEEKAEQEELKDNKNDSKMLSSYKRLRRAILDFIETIVLMICVCCINIAGYAMRDYSGRLSENYVDENINSIADDIEFATEVCFIIEISFELIARGLFRGRRAFFKNPWLVCNLISIICSGVTQLPDIPNKVYLVCRILSMLRPLRIIQMITPLKIEVERLLRSIPKINLSIWRLIIFMAFYSIVGLHIFMGTLEYRCRVSPEPPQDYDEKWEVYQDIPFLCGRWQCPDESYCRSPYDYSRPFQDSETDIKNLNYGYTNFDNFGSSFFTVFHIMRIISWGRITFMYWRQMSTVLVASYFLSLVLICSYVLSNIILAELYESFEQQRNIKSYAEYKLQLKMEKEKNNKVNIKDIELEYLKQINNDIPADGEIIKKKFSQENEFMIEEEIEEEIYSKPNGFTSPKDVPLFQEKYLSKTHIKLQLHDQGTEQIIQNANQQINASKVTLSNQTASLQENQNQSKTLSNKNININLIQIDIEDVENGSNKQKLQADTSAKNQNGENGVKSPAASKQANQSTPHQQKMLSDMHFISEEKLKEKKPSCWESLNGFSGILSIIFRLAILLDIVVISADRYNISKHEEEMYIEIDWIILWVFMAEIAVKMIQLRKKYFKDILNDIDLVILVIRFISSNYSLFSGSDITSEDAEWIHSIKAIHVFRIFQIVKNTQFFRTVNNLIQYFYSTFLELIYYILIIIFYSALFALIGHDLFAHKSEFVKGDVIPQDLKTGNPPRINYDTFFSSFEAVFLSVLNEQWNISMYDFMRSVGDYVCSFWIIIISTGEIFILKLLMALFINTFLKHFNNRKKDKNDEIEEAELNDIVRDQVMSAKTQHHGGHHEGNHKECFITTFCRKLENDHRFENFIMCVIVTNIIVMAVDSPLLDHHDPTKEAIHYLEMIFTGIYGLEILIKIFACGLFVKGGYFRDPKNLIDFSLFCLNIAGFIFSSKLGILNALRAFHIVVLSKHFESLRIILISLYKSLPYLSKLIFFALCFMLVFAVIPLRILKGKMFSCHTLSEDIMKLVVTEVDCYDLGGDWVRNDFHFDNILYSLFNLFIIASCEGWSYFSYNAQDAVGLNLQPEIGYNRLWSVFFIIHFFIGNIMVINAFTGVMTQKFNEINGKFLANQVVIPIKDKKFLNEYSSFKYTEKITSEDQEWLSIKRSIYHAKPIKTFEEPDPKISKVQYYVYKFISHKAFELFIDGCTILSAIIFSMYVHRVDQEYTDMLNNINDIMVLIYCVEILLKIFVERKQFFYNRENLFLLFILITSIIPTVYRLNKESDKVSVYFKLLEVFRVLRLINTIPMIQSIFSMMKFILPQVAPLAAVYLFTIYIYALFGMSLFGFIKPQSTLNGYDLHFKNFTSSVFTLIRISSGEQWFYIVPDIVRDQQPNFVCNDISDVDGYHKYGLTGCGTIWGYLYFFTFHLIVSVIIFNLFIAVLLGLIKTQNTAVSKYQLAQIKDLWRTYDRKGYGFIDYKNFWQFTSRIAMIYGVKKDDLIDPNQKKNFLKFLSLPIYTHKRKDHSIFGFRFHDVVVKMTQISLFLKYGILPGGKEESQSTLVQFYKELDEDTKFVGELAQLKSGDIAVIILIQRRIKTWMRKGIELHSLKKNKPEEYSEILKNIKQNKQPGVSNIKRNSIAATGLQMVLRPEKVSQLQPVAEDTKLKQEDNGSNENKLETPPMILTKQQNQAVFNYKSQEDLEQSENYDKQNIDENQDVKSSIRVFETAYMSHHNIKLN